ncbi:MAG: hypothetical protein ABIB71_00805 [Candidatus Woesearchaeota archaeon]
MDRREYSIVVKRHAFVRAVQRKIHPDIVENTIKNGRIQRYGKNYVKFISKTAICVGEISVMKIKIITIERRKR